MQTERRTKQIHLFFMPRCSLSYQKIMQTERRTKQIHLFFMPRCSLSSQKIMQNPIKKRIFAHEKSTNMEIKSAEFIISNTDIAKCPDTSLPEYAFIGRSNVGKSSLINMLANHRKLAKTSATPGKTLLINHFLINKEWYLVDLPGYGYAKKGKEEREKLWRIITSYILRREQLTNLFVLVDSRHEPQKIDLEFIEWLGENGVPFSIVFTKADKQGIKRLNANIKAYLEVLKEQWEELPPYFATSSLEKTGRTELLDYIESINRSLAKNAQNE